MNADWVVDVGVMQGIIRAARKERMSQQREGLALMSCVSRL